jgi:uncharacterized membrane protein
MFKAIWKQEDHSLMIGFFGWLGPRLPRWIRITYWAALGLTAVLDGGKRIELGLRAKAVLFGVYVITAAAMVTMIYLSWERVGMTSIGGMQPRYFLPILPLVLLPLRGDAAIASSQLSRTAVPIIAMAVITLAAGATWWTMVMRYYW